MRRFLRNNGLSLVMLLLFGFSFVGQAWSGAEVYNDDQVEHGAAPIAFGAYLRTGHFVEAVFENWESEFLQMAAYVWLTVFLYQKGSGESKPLAQPDPVDADPHAAQNDPAAPWPVRRGGWVLKLYANSLTLALFGLFVIAFGLHALGGAHEYNAEQLAHGGSIISTWRFVTSHQFWFESFQNWQSEFLSVATLVILSIFLRQQGSPESKPVAAPHHTTGKE